jgi:hypothetical protein
VYSTADYRRMLAAARLSDCHVHTEPGLAPCVVLARRGRA